MDGRRTNVPYYKLCWQSQAELKIAQNIGPPPKKKKNQYLKFDIFFKTFGRDSP